MARQWDSCHNATDECLITIVRQSAVTNVTAMGNFEAQYPFGKGMKNCIQRHQEITHQTAPISDTSHASCSAPVQGISFKFTIRII